MTTRLPTLAALLLVPAFAGAVERNQPVVSVESGVLPALPGPGGTRLVSVAGRAVAIAAESAWLLGVDRRAWIPQTWRPRSRVLATAVGAGRAFLVVEADGSASPPRVEELVLAAGALASHPVASLTRPFQNVAGAVDANVLHVAGHGPDGQPRVSSLSLANPAAGWTESAPAHGAGAITSLAAQFGAAFATVAHEGGDRLLRWSADEGWREFAAAPGSVLGGSARAIGQSHLLYLIRPRGAAGDGATLATFSTVTKSWAALADLPAGAATAVTPWQDGLMWLEPGPGGAAVSFAQLRSGQLFITLPDWIVLVVYLAAMIGIGLYFYLREKRQSTADFFVGSRTIPFWAAGVSLYATNTSSISYIAIPAKAFETNWQYLTNNLVAITGLVFVAIWIVPLLRRLNLMSVFHYLEIRFHPAIRTLASALCILVQIGSRLSVILFLPSLAIATMTGLDVVWCILIMGGVTIAYTALGGMKAVIWTDFAQLIVMFGGALFAIAFTVWSLDGGIPEFLTASLPEDKMKLFDWSWDLTEATVWGFIFLVVFDVVLTFPKDQVLMQRVLSTRNDRDAGRSVWMFAAIMLPGGFMFYLIGTALYVFYQSHPERLDPLMPLDATFPLFIAAELPVGVTGLIIAGILAASMSTLSSIMNSVATLASVDFYEKWVKKPDPKTSVRFAEWMTVVTGLIGIGAAWLLSRYDIRSLFDVSIELAGLMGGGFAGAYSLGMFTRRANWQGVSIGIGSAILLTTIAWTIDLVHPYFYLAISIMICIVIGYLASLLFPPPAHSLAGLTIHRAG
ncbi:MAG: sodium:solute symporter family transporter [Gammaproteobacteria bacterium]